MSNSELLNLAERHLKPHVAAWMMKLEKDSKKPVALDELEKMMLKEFAPSGERARARMKLMTFKQVKDIETCIARFQELVEACNMGATETHLFFFFSLNGEFKEECAKELPRGEPGEMQAAHDFACAIDRSLKWNPEAESSTRSAGDKGSGESAGGDGKVGKGGKGRGNGENGRGSGKKRDDTLASWGPCQSKERSLHRNADRCFTCGYKGYSAKSCRCRKEHPEESSEESTPKG